MEDYKQRFIDEYRQLDERIRKLDEMLEAWMYGNLNFEPSCPRLILENQLYYMKEYRKVLRVRAQIEDIALF